MGGYWLEAPVPRPSSSSEILSESKTRKEGREKRVSALSLVTLTTLHRHLHCALRNFPIITIQRHERKGYLEMR